MRDWVLGSAADSWVSMGIYSHGDYNVSSELMYSFPVHCNKQTYSVVENLALDEFSRKMIAHSEQELIKERDMIRHLLK